MKYKSSESKQREILDKALELFLKDGYQNVSIARLAKETGMAKGLMYYYYESKDALLVAVIDDLCTRHANQLMKSMSEESIPYHDKLLYLLDAYHEIHPENESSIDTTWLSHSSFVSLFHKTFLEKIEPILVELAQETEILQKVDFEHARFRIIMLIEGVTGLTRLEDISRTTVIRLLEQRFNLPKNFLEASGQRILIHFHE